MSLAKTADSQRELPTEKEIDVASTASGGEDVARAIYRSGCFVGYRTAEKRPPADVPVDFIDWPFDCERADYFSGAS